MYICVFTSQLGTNKPIPKASHLRIPTTRCTTREDAVSVLRDTDRLCTLMGVQLHRVKNPNFLKCALIQRVFCELIPVPVPMNASEAVKKTCIWSGGPILYARQLDILLLLVRITQHFHASIFSLRSGRSFDAVRLMVMGAITVLADAIIRKRSSDIPSDLSLALRGTKDKSKSGFYVSAVNFAQQCNNVLVISPALNTTRSAILDYFDAQKAAKGNEMFSWERGNGPQSGTTKFLKQICEELGT